MKLPGYFDRQDRLEHFDELLIFKPLVSRRRGLKTKEGSIVDATLVGDPIRRDRKEDNDAIKAGEFISNEGQI